MKPGNTYMLSPMQQGMLYHMQAHPDTGVDIEQVSCHFKESIDLKTFQKAWDTLINRHEILRTSFDLDDSGLPFQQIHDSVTPSWQVEDWSADTQKVNQQKLLSFLEEDRKHDFDFKAAPLMRFALFNFGNGESHFVWTFHHILLDGRSFIIILQELFLIYSALLESREVELTTSIAIK